MTAPLQYFSVCRSNDALVTVSVDSTVAGDTLVGSAIWWKLYAQKVGVPTGDAMIVKTNDSGGGGLTVPGSPPMIFTVELSGDETTLDLGNYYFQADVFDEIGGRVTVVAGILTITQAL